MTVNNAAAPLPQAKPRPADDAAPLPGRKPAAADGAADAAANSVVDAAALVARPSGHSFSAILSQATQESGLNTKARNRNSSAAGPFQFLERTWLDMVRRHGAAYGLSDLAQHITVRHGVPTVDNPQTRQQILALREDPQIAGGMAARHLAEGREVLAKKLGRPVSEVESRIAYVMGAGGAARLIRASEQTPAAVGADLLPDAARANRTLFHNQDGTALTAREIVARLSRRMQSGQNSLAALTPAEPKATRFDGVLPATSGLLAQEIG